jgi:hypothetical protein
MAKSPTTEIFIAPQNFANYLNQLKAETDYGQTGIAAKAAG